MQAGSWQASRTKAGLGLSLLGLALLAVLPAVAVAAPGDLDPSFGTGGLVTSSDGGSADVVVLSDGKLITVGSEGECSEVGGEYTCHSEFLVERYNEDGTLDTTFGGGDGKVTTSFGSANQSASSVAVESSGKLVVAGTTYDEATEDRELAVARYNANGTLDTSFGGGDGKLTIAVTNPRTLQMWSRSLVLQPDGKIVVGGDIRIWEEVFPEFSDWEHHPVLVRLNADGSVDSSFGNSGTAIGPRLSLFGLAEEPGGKLLGAGQAGASFAVARLNADGSTDTSFGNGGIASMYLSEGLGSKADDVLVQPDGKIVATGYGFGYAVARFNSDGTPDPTFGGGDGLVMTFFNQPCCGLGAAISAGLQSDGRIVFAGQWTPDEDTFEDEWGLGRLYSNGFPDESFGDGGLVTQNFGGIGSGDASRMAIQPDGKIVAVGGIGGDFGMLRLMGGGSSVPPSTYHLLIAKSGADEGSVYGPDTLNCGANCGVDYLAGETVEVYVYPEEGSSFTGWTSTSGDPGTCTGTVTICEVTLNEDVDLTAHFGGAPPASHQLEVSKAGSGAGTVTSSPGGIDCGSTCSAEFDDGAHVALTAAPAPGSVFMGWSGGGCSGVGPCQVVLNSDASVTASFAPQSSEEGGGSEGGGEGPAGQPGGGPSPTPATTPPPKPGRPLAVADGVAVAKGARVTLRLRCAGTESCSGVVKLLVKLKSKRRARGRHAGRRSRSTRNVLIGKSRFSIPAGHHRAIRVKLTDRGNALLRRAGKHGLTARLRGRGIKARSLHLKPPMRQSHRKGHRPHVVQSTAHAK